MWALPDTTAGRLLFGFCKVWLLALPLLWLRLVEREPLSWSPVRKGGWRVGLISGLLIFAVILGLYFSVGQKFIDHAWLVAQLRNVGLAVRWRYLLAATYWITVNSALEEYVWRWFCVRQAARIWRRPLAVAVSALCFTLHHIVAMAVYFETTAVVICSLGVFLGGLIWSTMYLRYGSIWPGYLSHVLADLAIFGLGGWLLFA